VELALYFGLAMLVDGSSGKSFKVFEGGLRFLVGGLSARVLNWLCPRFGDSGPPMVFYFICDQALETNILYK